MGLGNKAGDPIVNMIRTLAYDPTGIIYLKINITEDYEQLPQRIGNRFTLVAPSQHLQDLKMLLPADCHYFYDNIPFQK